MIDMIIYKNLEGNLLQVDMDSCNQFVPVPSWCIPHNVKLSSTVSYPYHKVGGNSIESTILGY